MPTVIPILRSADLDGTTAFYEGLGFAVARRYDDYLLLADDRGLEVHFFADRSTRRLTNTNGCYVRFATATEAHTLHSVWSQAKPGHVTSIETTDYGLAEFAIRDDDGNQIRVGGPTG